MQAFENFLRDARFLVVDDEPVSASAVEISLAAAGQDDVRIVSNPCEALEAYRTYQPDLVMLDLSMPKMNGFEVLEEIRKLIPPDEYLPIIVITADATETSRRRALASGANDFLTKPFGSSELRLRVENLLRTRFLHMGFREQNKMLERRVTERTQELEAALTELRDAQKQAIREQRLHAFSEMGGGVVHDFNNVLMILMSLTELVERDAQETNPRIAGYAETMQGVLKEAAQLISRLNYFCRPRHDDDLFMPTDLKKLLEEAVLLARPKWHDATRARGCEIRLVIDAEEVDLLPCNGSEMREAFFHLILNAVDAMPKGGTLSVNLRACEDGTEIFVSDTGTGMTEEVRARCLEPYFTTKGETNKGLGLAMVHGIVRRHGAAIEINSREGEGSIFRIFFPHENMATQVLRPCPTIVSSRPLRILLAEDDERLRQLMALQMESMGHHVEMAADGNEALVKFHLSPFDLILTDLSMPRMNGLALVQAARQIIAEIPVIMLTGYGAMLLPDGGRPPGVDILLSKPVTRDNLAAAIAQVAA